MKKKMIILGVLILLFSGFFVVRNNMRPKTKEELINIDTLSKEFMTSYLENMETTTKDNNKDNILIVVSNNDVNNTYGATNKIEAPNNQYFLQYEDEETTDNAYDKLKSNSSIISVEKNEKFQIDTTTYNSWGIQAQYLDYATEIANENNLNSVIAAVIDTGCDTDLVNKYYTNKIAEVYDVLTGSSSTITDLNGHGTHIVGTIAEGTPSNVKIMPIRVSEDGEMYISDVITAINYINYYNKADVINMSFGTYTKSDALEQAIISAKDKNIISIAAAGNDNTSNEHYPSGYTSTIAISAVDSNMNRSSFSNYGSAITFSAPGTSIKSLLSNEMSLAKERIEKGYNDGDPDREVLSGTSMASPHATAAVAILKSYNKNLTFDNVVELLKKQAKDLGPTGWDQEFGYGFINFENARFCNGINCDEYNVFKNENAPTSDYANITLNQATLTPYNYGSITNILATKLNVKYTDNTSKVKYLWELDDVEITGYDPYASGTQTVSIKYEKNDVNTTLNINVTNPTNYTSGWNYNIVDSSNKTIELTRYISHEKEIGKLYIPKTIDGYTVVGFANFESNKDLFNNANDLINYKYLYLPSSFEYFGNNSMRNTMFEYINGDCSKVKVGDYAFYKNDLLEFNIPVSSLGISSFEQSSNLKEISLSKDTIDIPNNAFKDSPSLEKVSLEENAWIETIGDSAFENCYNLNKFDLSNIATSIGNKAFMHCHNIYEANLNWTVEAIGEYAFAYTNIASFKIPICVNTIEAYTFYNCNRLKNIEFGHAQTIKDNAFSYTNINDLIIYNVNNVTSISDTAFDFVPLQRIIVNDSNPVYDSRNSSNALIETSTNKLIKGSSRTVIPDTVTEIGKNAFLGNNYLTNIKIPESVNTIDNYAFNSCVNLSKIIMPKNNITIGDKVFKSDYTNSNSSNIPLVMYVYKNSSSHTFALNNNFNYRYMEPATITVNYDNSSWVALTSVPLNKITIKLTYDDPEARTENLTYTNNQLIVRYQDGRNHFEYGDTYFTVTAYNELEVLIEKQVPVTIKKATPTYTTPSGLMADKGTYLSAINLPNGFEWMYPSTKITQSGTNFYKARYTPTDTKNYDIVENINIPVNTIQNEFVKEMYNGKLETFYYINGVKQKGFQTYEGKLYFFSRVNYTLKTGWQESTEGKWYQDKNGVVQTGLKTIDGKTYYFNDKGIMQIGFQTVNGKLYFFSRVNGTLKTGWQESTEGKWYQKSTGEVVTGLQTISNNKYYFNDKGIMQTGFITLDGKLYFFSRVNGTLKTGWQQATEGKWYQKSTGEVVTGLQTISNNKYYFNNRGIMQTGFITLDDKLYFFSRVNGTLKTGWQESTEGKWYQKSTGEVVTGLQTISNNKYYFNNRGIMQTGFITLDGKLYFFSRVNGTLKTGWQESTEGKWYQNADGEVLTGTQIIDGKKYTFNSRGILIS